jgi:hypothetical protein
MALNKIVVRRIVPRKIAAPKIEIAAPKIAAPKMSVRSTMPRRARVPCKLLRKPLGK